jgi:hypothetical protein
MRKQLFHIFWTLKTDIDSKVYQCTRRVRKVKIHHVWVDRELFYAYYGMLIMETLPSILILYLLAVLVSQW